MISMTGNGVADPSLSLVTFPLTVKVACTVVVVDVVDVVDVVVAAVVVVVELLGLVDVFLVHATARRATETASDNAVPNRIVCFI